MHLQTQTLFLLLIISQTLHSIEEYIFQLWEVLAPARFISGLIATDLAVGYSIANATIVAFGFWCYFGPVHHNWKSANFFMWFWVLLELGNSIGHTLFAVNQAGYFPGLYSTPLLFAFSLLLLLRLLKSDSASVT